MDFLKSLMHAIWSLHFVDIQSTVEQHGYVAGDSIIASGDFSLEKDLCNDRRNQREAGPEHESLMGADMVAVVILGRDSMRCGAQDHRFGSTLQFGDRYDVLRTNGEYRRRLDWRM